MRNYASIFVVPLVDELVVLKLTNVHKRKKNGHNFEKNIEVRFHHLCMSFFRTLQIMFLV
jgi:hypothetical protein